MKIVAHCCQKQSPRSVTVPVKQLASVTLLSLVLAACGGGSGTVQNDNKHNNSADSGSNSDSSNKDDADNNATGNVTGISNDLNTNAAVAKNFIDNLVIPAYQDFAKQAAGFEGAVSKYCATIGTADAGNQKAATQAAWLALKNRWHSTALYAVGPVAANGAALAKRIYTPNRFDTSTQQAISAQVSKLKAEPNHALSATTAYSARGLDALEYLLFTDTAAIDTDHCNYARVIAKDITQGANAINAAWVDNSTGRNAFLTNNTTNGADLVQPFFDNTVTVIDKSIKDTMLAEPLALKAQGSCAQDACPELVNNRLSQTTYDSIRATLTTLDTLYTGAGGAGFQVYFEGQKLSSEGAAFQALIDDAIKVIDGQGKSLYLQASAINTGNKGAACSTVSSTGQTKDTDLGACAVYHAVKKLSDDVKTGAFKVAVNLSLPTAAAGDGD